MNAHIKETIESVNRILENKKRDNFNLETDEPYQTLMKKEEKVLNLIDDIHKHNVESRSNVDTLLSSPLHVVVLRTLNTLTDVFNELSEASTMYDVLDAIVKKERATYIGIVFVFLAIILMFVTL